MQYVNKNITTVKSPALIMHGVNCQRRMESGVAKALYSKWPEIKRDYMKFAKDEMVLGKVSAVKIEESLYILNCWTQDKFGYDNKIYASIQAIKECVEKSIIFCKKKGIKAIFLPRIGCGLGGLDWKEQIEPIFRKLQKEHSKIAITICDFN